MSDGDFLGGLTYFLALIAAIPAVVITWLLLRRYRKSILRLMGERGVDEHGPAPATSSTVNPPAPDRHVPSRLEPDTLGGGVRRNVAVVVIIGALSGMAFAILFLAWNDLEFSPYRLVFLAVPYAWPAVLGVWIVTAGDRRWVWGTVGIYFAVLLAAGLIGGLGPLEPFVFWAWSLIPTAAVVVFLTRPMRGVGTLVLGAMMAGIVGSQAFAVSVVGSDTLLRLWVDTSFAVGVTDAGVMFLGMQLAGFLGALLGAIVIIRLLAGWYARHGFSDQMLLLGSVFLVFAIDAAVTVSPSDARAFASGLGIYVGLGVVALVLYRLAHRSRAQAPTLLMLRVFSPHQESQRLLDHITGRWRYLGPVRMIGGPDLAMATVEPDEFLTFVLGQLRRLFIDRRVTLEERLESLNNRPDPDGRFRIEEFFCFDDTWRLTVVELLERSDSVMMDLRGFGADNQGCIDEIELLASEHALSRTVLLVDSATDRQLLDSVLEAHPGPAAPTVIALAGDDQADQAVASCLALATGVHTRSGTRFPGSD